MIYETLTALRVSSLLDAQRQSIENNPARMASTTVLARSKGNARGEAETV
jgi:hypothetical protein